MREEYRVRIGDFENKKNDKWAKKQKFIPENKTGQSALNTNNSLLSSSDRSGDTPTETFRLSRRQAYGLGIFMLTSMIVIFPAVAAADMTSSKKEHNFPSKSNSHPTAIGKKPSTKKKSPIVETVVDAYPGYPGYSGAGDMAFFTTQIKHEAKKNQPTQHIHMPKIESSIPFSREGIKTKQELLAALTKLQAGNSSDSRWISETLLSQVNGHPLKIVFVQSSELTLQSKDGSSIVTHGQYLPSTHSMLINMDYYKFSGQEWSPKTVENLVQHELWHCRQRILNDQIPSDKEHPGTTAQLMPFNTVESHKQFLKTVHQEMANIERFRKKLQQKGSAVEEIPALAGYPLRITQIRDTEENLIKFGIRKVGDKRRGKDGQIQTVVKIEIKKGISVADVQTNSPHHSFLADYDDIIRKLETDYNFKRQDPEWLAKFKKQSGLEYISPKWLAEFDAYLTGNFSPEVRKHFFPNLEKYHVERAAMVEKSASVHPITSTT